MREINFREGILSWAEKVAGCMKMIVEVGE